MGNMMAAAQAAAMSTTVAGLMGELMNPILRSTQAGFNATMPNMYPPVPSLIQAYHTGMLPDLVFAEMLRANGVDIGAKFGGEFRIATKADNQRAEVWQKIIAMAQSLPSLGEIREGLNRQIINEDKAVQWLRIQGFSEDIAKNILIPLRSQLPGASDLIRFAVREVWNEKIVSKFGYDEEFPLQFADWMKALGYIGDPSKSPDHTFLSDLKSWAQAYWRAHWDIISPTQSYVAYQRLRMDKTTGKPRSPSGVIFDKPRLQEVLKIHDYPPYFRDVLAAISYRTLTRVDIRRAFRIGVIKTRDELIEFYKDTGYDDREAGILADITINEYQPKAAVRRKQVSKETICRLYSVGVMPRESAMRSLHLINLPSQDSVERFERLPQFLQDIEVGQDLAAKEFLNICDLKAEEKLVNASIRAIRKRYMMGDLSDSDAQAELTKLKITPTMIQRYVRHWNLMRTVEYKYSMADLASRHCKKGYITILQFKRRLRNLGWNDDEIERIASQSDCWARDQSVIDSALTGPD